jgi:hypothetical protein
MRILADDVYSGLMRVAEDHGISQNAGPTINEIIAYRNKDWEGYDLPATFTRSPADAELSLLIRHALLAASGY